LKWIKTMKAELIITAFLFAGLVPASAQASFGAPYPAACGPKDTGFDVSLDKSQHPLAQPEEGKARIYFIHDEGAAPSLWTREKPILIGMDGAWVGANSHNSYFSVSINPGEHHICSATPYNRQVKLVALTHLQAEAGRVYFFRTRVIVPGAVYNLEISSVDNDEGEYLIASYPLSIFHPKR
jgi:hypothetical protein